MESPEDQEAYTEIAVDGVLDLHTFRPGEVREILPEYLRIARRRGVLDIRIVHGKGTGTLRRLVLSVLRNLPGIAEIRGGDETCGSWGATLVRLYPRPEGGDAAAGEVDAAAGDALPGRERGT